MVPLFRSTGDHIARLRAWWSPSPRPQPAVVEVEPLVDVDELAIRVSSEFTDHCVRVVVGTFPFTLSRKMAFEFAKQVEGAADALGPEPPASKEVAIDITDEVEDGKEEGDG